MLVLDFTETDSVEGLIETCGDRTGLPVFGNYILLAGVEVINLAYGRSHGGGADSSGLVKLFKLIHELDAGVI